MSAAVPLEVDVQSVSSALANAEPFFFMDCREASEFATAHIEGAQLFPMSELQERIGELEQYKQQRVVVHCHHGGRSLRVANWLRAQGFDQAQSMAGGIDAWSLQIDTEVPRY